MRDFIKQEFNKAKEDFKTKPSVRFLMIVTGLSALIAISFIFVQGDCLTDIFISLLFICIFVMMIGAFAVFQEASGMFVFLITVTLSVFEIVAYMCIYSKLHNLLFLFHEKTLLLCWGIYNVIFIILFSWGTFVQLKKIRTETNPIFLIISFIFSYFVILVAFIGMNTLMLHDRNVMYNDYLGGIEVDVSGVMPGINDAKPLDKSGLLLTQDNVDKAKYLIESTTEDRIKTVSVVGSERKFELTPCYNVEIKSDDWFTQLYFNVISYFTIGYGDISPISSFTKMIAIFEAFMGHVLSAILIPLLFVFAQEVVKKD